MSDSTPPYESEWFPRNTQFHGIFFILFLLVLPLSIRKVLVVFSPDGSFNEYLDISLYLSDVLLIATLALFILENKKQLLSISYWRRMFHVEHLLLPIFIPAIFILWSGLSIFWSESHPLAVEGFFKLFEGYFLYLYIVICSVPRGTISDTRIQEKMFHVEHSEQDNNGSSKINVPRGTFLKQWISHVLQCSTWNILKITMITIVISAFFQGTIAIFQFLRQKSLGLTILRESVFTVHDTGIAKVVIDGNVFVRSYGLFPHPNVLGGFLTVSLLMTIAYPMIFGSKLFHVEQLSDSSTVPSNVPRGTIYRLLCYLSEKCSTWNISWFRIDSNNMFHVEHIVIAWLYRILVFVQLLSLSFSFSKSGFIAFIIGLIMFIFGVRTMFHVEQLSDSSVISSNVPRGTIQNKKIVNTVKCSTWNICSRKVMDVLKQMFHVEHLFIIAGGVLAFLVLFLFNLKLFIVQPLVERLFYISSINGLFKGYLFGGLGVGQFVFDMQHFFTGKLLVWQLQPIHNVFLLVLSELGLIGLILFIWFIVFVFLRNNENVPRGTFSLLDILKKKCSTWNIISVVL